MKAVNAAVRMAEGFGTSDDEGSTEEKEEAEWKGASEPDAIDHEDEYLDEERHTTVTIETVEVTRDGLRRNRDDIEDDDDKNGEEKTQDYEAMRSTQSTGKSDGKKHLPWSKDKPARPKTKKKKFRYESKADRKTTRAKERSGNKAHAKARKT